MGKRADIGMGYRAAAKVRRLFSSTKQAAIQIGCGKNTIHEWSYGIAPSAFYLRRLYELGADVIWILTGKRERK